MLGGHNAPTLESRQIIILLKVIIIIIILIVIVIIIYIIVTIDYQGQLQKDYHAGI